MTGINSPRNRPGSTRKQSPKAAPVVSPKPERTPSPGRVKKPATACPTATPEYGVKYLLSFSGNFQNTTPDYVNDHSSTIFRGDPHRMFRVLSQLEHKLQNQTPKQTNWRRGGGLVKSKTSWQRTVRDQIKKHPLVSKVRSCLNKVTKKTLDKFSGELSQLLAESEHEEEDVLHGVIETFVSTLFKKACLKIEAHLGSVYIQLLQGIQENVAPETKELLQLCLEDKCLHAYDDVSVDRKDVLKGAANFIGLLFLEKAVDVDSYNGAWNSLMESLDSTDLAVQALAVEVGAKQMTASFDALVYDHADSLEENMELLEATAKALPKRIQFLIMDLKQL